MKLRVWTGAPGSGKTTRLMAEFRVSGGEAVLLVPTATMAEHVRNELARSGERVAGGGVATLYGFVEALPGLPPLAPAAADALWLERYLGRECPAALRPALGTPGLRPAVEGALEALERAGLEALTLESLEGLGVVRTPVVKGLRQVMGAREEERARRGELGREARLREAARLVREGAGRVPKRVFLDGFFSLSPGECELVKALARKAEVTLTLPAWPGAADVRQAFLRQGAVETVFQPVRPAPLRRLVSAVSREAEALEIARRILELRKKGWAWNECGVVLRAEEPYAALLETVFDRCGIPARFHFGRRLAAEYPAREMMPPPGLLDDGLRRAAVEWRARWREQLAATPGPADRDLASREGQERWARRGAALKALAAVVDEVAELVGDEPVDGAAFAQAVKTAAESVALYPAAGPRDVVHVMDAYEARQWELRAVFVAGLVEGEFPRHEAADPLLGESVRQALREQGFALEGAADRRATEAFLLEMAFSRATEEMVLSWPAFNEKGEPSLRSFVLDRFPEKTERAARVRVEPGQAGRRVREPMLRSDEAKEALAAQFQQQSPTRIESFLQCPFQFFGRHTLGLRETGDALEELLGPLALGTLVHDVLNGWQERLREGQAPEMGAYFDERWLDYLRRKRVPEGFRAEAARATLRQGLVRFAAGARPREGWRLETEEEFLLDLGGLRVKGRIDRFDHNEERHAELYEFKLSSESGVSDRVKRHMEGAQVQGGLYALALQERGYKIEKVMFVPLKGHGRPLGWQKADEIQVLMEHSVTKAREAQTRILAGVVAPEPFDARQCQWCEMSDACRVGSGAAAVETA